MRSRRKTTSFDGRRRFRRGFTLVELIVVLTILAILAAIAVGSAVGYINRSKLDKNNQNAITVYQAAQAALSQKVENGTMSDWVSGTLMTCDGLVGNGFPTNAQGKIEGLTNVNDSRHTTVALTYNSGASNSASQTLYGLLGPYFYDQSVFGATITVVFDVSVTYQGDGEPLLYSANVMATFYSLENPADEGWDASYIHAETDLTLDDSEPWKSLPCTVLACRYKSYVGFYNGTEESIVGPVALRGEETAEDVIFTLRNGETLDVTWSFIGEEAHDKNVRLKFFNAETGSVVATLDFDESSFLCNPSNVSSLLAVTYNDATMLPTDGTYTSNALSPAQTVYESITKNGVPISVTRTSYEGLASVVVNGDSSNRMVFPVTITRVDETSGMEPRSYLTYTLSLDCMMTRYDYDTYNVNGDKYNYLYCSRRIFGEDPINIYAEMVTLNNGTESGQPYVAQRALNDPIYFSNNYIQIGGHTYYCYNNASSHGQYDTDEKCVVNTMFGDCFYSSSTSLATGTNVGGTTWTSTECNAVITSCRHLSNIRMIGSGKTVNYRIVRDLNWYYSKAETGTIPLASARVYESYNSSSRSGYSNNTRFRSPVESGEVHIVSFPALHELCSSQSLSAMHRLTGDTSTCYSINNVQLRNASFKNKTDNAYALICENNGTIYSVYTNNLNLVLANVTDGADSDYICKPGNTGSSYICPNENVTIGIENRLLEDKPVGGLIGLNNYVVGSAQTNQNTICMSNSVVMAGQYWSYGKYSQGIGIIIGQNAGPNKGSNGTNRESVYGILEVRGLFAVVGQTYVGGAIGYNNNTDISGRIIVDGTPDGTSEFILPVEQHIYDALSDADRAEVNNATSAEGRSAVAGMTCVVSSHKTGGGAIGYFYKSKFVNVNQYIGHQFSYNNEVVSGEIRFSTARTADDYMLNVTLPQNSLIIQNGEHKEYGIGGAIGYINNCSGTYISFIQRNSGNIILINTSTNLSDAWNFCGGVVGRDNNSTIGTILVTVENTSTSRIGSFDENLNTTIAPTNAGGAFGGVQGTGSVNNSTNRIFAINAVNDGTIVGRADSQDQGVGGAIGGVGKQMVPVFVIRVTNRENSSILSTNNSTNNPGGVGGAIGGIRRADNTLSISARSVLYVENSGTISGYRNAGGVIGTSTNTNNGRITAVNSGAHIYSNTGTNAGGAVGNGGVDNNSVITATNDSNTIIQGSQNVGGAVGFITNNGSSGNVIATNSNSTIEGTTTATNLTANVGGTIGNLTSNKSGAIITATNSSSTISGVRGNIGGAVGYVTTNESSGQITANNDGTAVSSDNNRVGGSVGNMSTNSGSITAESVNSTSITGSGDIGGSIGSMATNESSGQITANNNGTTVSSSGNKVGGAVGNMSTNSGLITAESVNSTSITGDSDIGGAIGYMTGNSKTVTSTVTDSSIKGSGNYIGGAIGFIDGNNNANSDIHSTLVRSIVDGTGSTGSVGGAVGKMNDNNGTIQSDNTDTEISSSANSVGGALGSMGNEKNNSGSIIANNNGSTLIHGKNQVGGAFGNAHYNTGTITATNNGTTHIYGTDSIGGALGKISYENKNNGSITSTLNNGTRVDGSSNIGGAVGSTKNNSGTITANLNGATVGSLSSDSVGGAVGGINNDATNSGTIVSNNTSSYIYGSNAGGTIGTVSKNAVNSGTISAVNITTYIHGSNRIGGTVGYIREVDSGKTHGNGTIEANNSAGTVIDGTTNVGGSVGYINYNSNTVRVTNANMTIKGDNVGGIVGSITTNDGTVTGTNNAGTVIGTANSSTNVGGAIGVITTNNASRTVSVTNNSTTIQGKNYIGGVAGDVGTNGGTITATNSSGTVIGTENVSSYVGGATGRISSNLGTIVSTNDNTLIRGQDYIGGSVGTASGTLTLGGTISSTLRNNTRVIGSQNYIGGAIGNIAINQTNITADISNSSVTGVDFIGGAVGRATGKQEGTVSSTLHDGASVNGRDFVGGAAGSLQQFSCFGTTKTVVSSGTVSVNGRYFVGGVCGETVRYHYNGNSHTNPSGTTTHQTQGETGHECDYDDDNGILILAGGSSDTACLNVVGSATEGIGAGGAVGMMRTDRRSIIGNLYMPTQEAGNRLIVNVNGHESVGGAIGEIRSTNQGAQNTAQEVLAANLSNQNVIFEVNVVLRPESHITGTGSNVGGAIGFVNTSSTSFFSRSINVSTVAGSTATDSGITGLSNVGGAVGHFNNSSPMNLTNDVEIVVDFSESPYNITATIANRDANAGGAIGRIEGTCSDKNVNGRDVVPLVPPITVDLGSSNVVSSTGTGSNIGGAIGDTSIIYTGKLGKNYRFYDNWITVNTYGSITGLNNIGGAVGYNRSVLNRISVTIQTGGVVSGSRCIGTAIGLTQNGVNPDYFDCTVNGTVTGSMHVNEYLGYIGWSDVSDWVSIEDATVYLDGIPTDGYVYNGTAFEPDVRVVLGESTLIANSDFIVSYFDNVNAGTAKVEILGIGNYDGLIERSFEIKPIDISAASVSVSPESYTYTGGELEPASINVVLPGETTALDPSNYSVDYPDGHTNVGEVTVRVSGSGNYTGSANGRFMITPASITADMITLSGDCVYDGQDVCPTVTVTFGTSTLSVDTDYTVAFTNNVETRTGTVTVTGIGNFAGSADKDFTITLATHTVTLDYGEGYSSDQITAEYGSAVVLPTLPTREGWSITGWRTDDGSFDISSPITRDIVLYAVWTENSEPTDDADSTNPAVPIDPPETAESPTEGG